MIEKGDEMARPTQEECLLEMHFNVSHRNVNIYKRNHRHQMNYIFLENKRIYGANFSSETF